ncbi:hypothetical protein V5P93_005274 [Actinokineospora auranticolor]|uniref:Uncharacterized protein n=1 Tax=Actinokineospora auranticolor TaxID=155976 RepID=A0A2S6GD72_9PSEU|nr:hypothetical protein [Actinokineospora auranticolor]PPK63130.1 hypothetical protein CLV40_13263 [Actinokineospora auranticolor]
MTCPDCSAELAHCHGTLLTWLAECTDPACADPDPLNHNLIITTPEDLAPATHLPHAA